MTRFRFWSLLPGAVAVAAAASIASAGAQEISFRFNDPETEEMRAALDQFQQENPGIEVELQSIAWGEARQQFLREAAVGEGPDVVHIAFVWPRDMGTAGALLPLNDRMEAQPLQNGFDDFIATELAVGDGGEVYGVPWTTDTWAMVYRTDVLEAAGVEIPTDWEELREASRRIHETTGKVGFGFPAGSGASNTIWFLANFKWWSEGNALVTEDGSGGFKTDVTVEEVADTMRYFHSFLQEGDNPESMLGVTDWFDPAILEGMTNGDQGIAVMPPQQFKQVLASFQERNPGVEPPFVTGTTPSGTEGPRTHLGGRMLGINANTDSPDAAYKLVEFLTRQQVLQDYYASQFPAQKSQLQSIEFGPGLGGFAEQLQLARSWGAYSDGPAAIGTLWNETGRAFGSAFIGERTYEESAARLLESVEEQLQ